MLAMFTWPDANIAGNQSEHVLYNFCFITQNDTQIKRYRSVPSASSCEYTTNTSVYYIT